MKWKTHIIIDFYFLSFPSHSSWDQILFVHKEVNRMECKIIANRYFYFVVLFLLEMRINTYNYWRMIVNGLTWETPHVSRDAFLDRWSLCINESPLQICRRKMLWQNCRATFWCPWRSVLMKENKRRKRKIIIRYCENENENIQSESERDCRVLRMKMRTNERLNRDYLKRKKIQ